MPSIEPKIIHMKFRPPMLALLTIGIFSYTSCQKNEVPDNNNNNGCETSDLTVSLEVEGTTVTGFSITAFSQGGFGEISRTWSTGETVVFTLNDLTEGTYSIEVEDEAGCTASASVTIDPTPTVSDVDGNLYDVVVIGSQTWLAQNLNTTKFRNGDAIPVGIGNSIHTPALSVQWFGGTSLATTVHGTHYNWYALNDSRGVCPTDYHVASEQEWDLLTNGLGGSFTAGNDMKRRDIEFLPWSAGTGNIVVGSNSSGFSAVPSGFTNSTGNYVSAGYTASFWTSSENNSVESGLRQLEHWDGEVVSDSRAKSTGHSCRCIKD